MKVKVCQAKRGSPADWDIPGGNALCTPSLPHSLAHSHTYTHTGAWGRAKLLALAGCIALATIALHWNTVDGDFVWDDRRGVVENEDVRLDTPIESAFRNDFWG